VAKSFDTVWINSLLYMLTLLNFPSYIVHTICSYLRGRMFEASFQTATLSQRGMGDRQAQGGLISPVLFRLCIDMSSLSFHVDLAIYVYHIAIVATLRKATLLVSYIQSYLNDLQR